MRRFGVRAWVCCGYRAEVGVTAEVGVRAAVGVRYSAVQAAARVGRGGRWVQKHIGKWRWGERWAQAARTFVKL